MKEGRKLEYAEKTPDDELQKMNHETDGVDNPWLGKVRQGSLCSLNVWCERDFYEWLMIKASILKRKGFKAPVCLVHPSHQTPNHLACGDLRKIPHSQLQVMVYYTLIVSLYKHSTVQVCTAVAWLLQVSELSAVQSLTSIVPIISERHSV